ncbi:thiamine diphosphokinase [Eubacterium multiforme]|nr:thiamine diphosphokinase [Eubacterium multiforme]
MRAIIVSGGTSPSGKLLKSYLKEDDIIIGVDSGCNTLYKLNIMPNLILGDFDSIDKDVLNYFLSKEVNLERYSSHKDYSDTHLAYRRAKGIYNVSEILMFGVTGTRLDHTLGNIGLLFNGLKDNISIQIIDEHNRMFIVDKSSVIKKEEGSYVSFHALSEVVKNFTIRGGKYDLTDYNMKLLEPRAICNEFLDGDINITFSEGIILVMYTRD